MVTVIVIFDVAHEAVRRRVRALLHRRGFVTLFPNAMWGPCPASERSALLRALRRRLSPHAHRVLVLAVKRHEACGAHWLIGRGCPEG